MSTIPRQRSYRESLIPVFVSGLVATAILGIGYLAPRETSMGDAQRIVYVHVAVAWFGLLGLIGAAVCGLLYLLRRQPSWDHWAQACAEIGWLCASLTLVTGSMWAHAAWGTWWTWEPRLTTAFILWCMYSGYLIARNNIEHSERRARLAAVLAIVGALDVPLVVVATRLFRGMHPVSPAMEPSMRLVLWLSISSFSLFFLWVLTQRRRQIGMAQQLFDLEAKRGQDSFM
ncbi:MAG: cytochrome c biogenesis protein CcsA [Pirellulaceae bacterium]